LNNEFENVLQSEIRFRQTLTSPYVVYTTQVEGRMSSAPGNKPADEVIAAECLAVRLRAVNRAVSALYDEALRPYGLRVGQMNLLVAVARIGVAIPAALCRVLQMEKSTLSRDLQVMCRNGWLTVRADGGRARPIQISPSGVALLQRVLPAWRDAQRRATELLGDEGARAVVAMAGRISFPSPNAK
jgi:DNA-binding MarR family transcriptional regulator